MKGCSSHACMVAKPEGMGTNSTKCCCPEWRIRRAILGLSARLETAERERDRLSKAARAVLLTTAGGGRDIEHRAARNRLWSTLNQLSTVESCQ